MQGRFLTLNAVIRFNQIEARPDLFLGEDESHMQSVETVEAFREAIAAAFPEGKITWAFTWNALASDLPNFVGIRKRVKEYSLQYGDDVTYNPGAYFANAYSSREEVNREIDGGLLMLKEKMGIDKPQSIIAGFLAAENQQHLAETHGIHVCQGNIWSQYSIDNQDGDGSICYPYYPSKEHFCKPAQGSGDFIDCVNMDGWTVDFLCGRREGFTGGGISRTGVGPIETLLFQGAEKGLAEMKHTTRLHFGENIRHNGFGWVTAAWENCLEYHATSYGYERPSWQTTLSPSSERGGRKHGQFRRFMEYLTEYLLWVKAEWPDTQMPTLGEFGLLWRKEHPRNEFNLVFDEEGSGIGGSDADKHIRWYMNPRFRLALLWPIGEPEAAKVIDFTRYDIPAREPLEPVRNWTLFGSINQKQTREQDAPIPLRDMTAEDREIIFTEIPGLGCTVGC